MSERFETGALDRVQPDEGIRSVELTVEGAEALTYLAEQRLDAGKPPDAQHRTRTMAMALEYGRKLLVNLKRLDVEVPGEAGPLVASSLAGVARCWSSLAGPSANGRRDAADAGPGTTEKTPRADAGPETAEEILGNLFSTDKGMYQAAQVFKESSSKSWEGDFVLDGNYMGVATLRRR